MGVLDKISLAFERRLAACFGRIGWEIAARPFHFILGLIVIAGILASGIPSIKSESEADNLYTPSFVNRGRDDLKAYDALFESVEGEQLPNYLIAFVPEDKEGNLLTPAVLNDLYTLHQKIKSLEVTKGSKTVTVQDLCVRSIQNGFENECQFHGVTDLMTGPIQAVSELNLDPTLTQDLQGSFQVTALFAGGRTLSSDQTTIEKVRAWRWTIMLDGGRMSEEDKSLEEDWMRLVLDTLLDESEKLPADSPYKLAFDVDFSQGEELDKSTGNDTSLLTITFVLVITFSFLIVRSYSDLILSKGNVVYGALLAIVLSLGSSFGLMGHCGVIFNPVVSTTSLLLLGLGMDDAYVIIQAWHSTAGELGPEATVQERMRRTYETAGVSVFFTSITDIIAFAVGCTSTFPAVRGFCAYTATGVFFVFLFQLLFFGAVMAIDGHREYCGVKEFKAYLGYGWLRQERYSPSKDLTARIAPGQPIPVMPEVAAVQKVMGRFGRTLLTPACSAAVVMVFAGYIAYAVVGIMRVGTGLDVRDLAPSDSYWTVFVNQRFNYFNEKGPLYSVAFPANSVDWSDKTQRASVLELMAGVEQLECLNEEPRGVWLREFYAANGSHEEAEGADFYALLDAWLQTGGYGFRRDVLLEQSTADSGWVISAARMEVRMVAFETTAGDSNGVPCMRDSRRVLDAWQDARSSDLAAPIISYQQFRFWEGSAVIVEQTTLNLAYAALGCFVMTLLVIPHPLLATLAMLVVAMILAGVVGTMALVLDIRIETISMINLVLSIGFSIDNVAHYCHAYMASRKTTRKDKALDALERIGVPILAGDASTMVALLPLLGSTSRIFRSFFLILFTVLLISALHAVIFLPVVLAWLGPLPQHRDADNSDSVHDSPALQKPKPSANVVDLVHSQTPSEGSVPDNLNPAPRVPSPVVISTRMAQA